MLPMSLRWKKAVETTLSTWVENVSAVSFTRPIFLTIWLGIISLEPIWSPGKLMSSLWQETNSINWVYIWQSHCSPHTTSFNVLVSLVHCECSAISLTFYKMFSCPWPILNNTHCPGHKFSHSMGAFLLPQIQHRTIKLS